MALSIHPQSLLNKATFGALTLLCSFLTIATSPQSVIQAASSCSATMNESSGVVVITFSDDSFKTQMPSEDDWLFQIGGGPTATINNSGGALKIKDVSPTTTSSSITIRVPLRDLNTTRYAEAVNGKVDVYCDSGTGVVSEGNQITVNKTSKSNCPDPQSDPTGYQSCKEKETTDKCYFANDKARCNQDLKCKANNVANYDRCMGVWECSLDENKGTTYAALFTNKDGTHCFTLQDFIPTLLSYFMMFAAIIAGFLFIWASYKYLTSKGDPSALAEARDMIMQVVIGLVILMLAYVIIQVLGSAFSGVDDSIQIWRPDMFKQE